MFPTRLSPATLFVALLLSLVYAPGRAEAQTYIPPGVAAQAGASSVALSWNPVPGAFSYNIYRGTAAGGESATPLATGVTGSTYVQDGYTDATAVNGTRYYYYVTTEDATGESDPSREVSATPGSALLTGPSLIATPAPLQVNLKWTAISGASYYYLYRCTDNSNFQCYLKNLPGPSFADTQVVSGVTYYYRVYAVSSNGLGSVSNTIAATPGGYAPSAPGTLDAYGYNNQVQLYWQPSPGATSYNVYRSTTAGGEGTTPYATGVGAQFYDNSVTNGTTYYYQVTAVNGNGEGPRDSNEAAATPSATSSPSALPAPALALTPGSGQIALRWGAVPGATSYNVYRSTDNSNYTEIKVGQTATTYTNTGLTNGVTYYYQVAARSNSGVGSHNNTAAGTPGATTLPVPAGVFAFPENATTAGLRWNPVPGASSYNLYRSTTAGGEGSVPYATNVTSANYGQYFFNDYGLTAGTTYHYKVSAVGGAGESGLSAEVSATPVNGPALPAPTLTATLTSTSGQVQLYWQPVSGATGYNLRRSTDNYNYVNVRVGLTGTSFTDTGLTSGTTYYYILDAVSAAGQGADSNTVSATPGSSSLPAPTGVRALNGNSYLSIGWNAVPGASSYNVYRSTSANGEGHVPYAAGVTSANQYGFYFNDSGVTTGTTYYYKITAVNATAQSGQSKEVTATLGTAALPPPTLTASASSGQVKLTWNAVAGAAGYSLYRSTDNTNYSVLVTAQTGTTYTDSAVTNGATYEYYVATDRADGESGGSNVVSATPGNTALPSPVGVRAYPNSTDGVAWNPVVGASSYNVYRSATAGGEGSVPYAVNVTTANQYGPYFQDSGAASGTTYFYKITAVSSSAQSAQSAEVSVTSGSASLAAPLLTATLTGTAGQIQLYWKSVAGAAGYLLFRSTDGYNFTVYQAGLTGTSYTDTGLTSGVTYYYFLSAVQTSGQGSVSNTVSATPGAASLPAPNLVWASPGGSITVQWNAVPGATSYVIYRGTAANGEGHTPYAVGVGSPNAFGPYFTDSAVTSGTPYFYKIAAVNASTQSGTSAEVSAKASGSAPSAPTLVANAGTGQITLTWGAVSGATGYDLYRSTDNAAFTAIQTGLTGTTYTNTGLTNGVTYYYQLNPLNADGLGAGSNHASATPGSATKLPAPASLIADAAYTAAYVYWSPVLGATSYNVYRSTTPGGEGSTPYATGVTTSNQNGPYFYESGLTNGTTYYYKVATVNGAGSGSQSAEVSVKVGAARPAGPSLTAVGSSGQVVLYWTAVAGAASYNIYRSTDNSYFPLLKSQVSGTSLTDTAVTNGVTYYYLVSATNATGEGQGSNHVSVVPGAPTLAAPTGTRAYLNSGYINLAWNPVVGASSYNIYRSTTANGEGHTPYAVGVVSSNPNGLYFTDGGVTSGTTYFYKVTAVNAAGQGGFSAEFSATYGGVRLTAPILTVSPGGSSSQLVLNWSAVPGAAGYLVFRCTDNSSFLPIKTGLTATTFTDTGLTAGVTYYYIVAAVAPAGEGSNSNTASAAPNAAALTAPAHLIASAYSNTQVNLSWTPVLGASSYSVYRGTSAGGEGSLPYATGIASAGYSDTNAASGTTYYYKVAAVSAGAQGPASGEASATPGSPQLSAPALMAVSGTSPNQVTLTWNAVAGAAGYSVFRSITNANFTILATPSATTLTDTAVGAGVTYYYYVAAYNADGLGLSSNTASAGVGIPVLPSPTALIANPGSASVALIWNPVIGAASYNVYRGTTAGGEGSVPYATGLTAINLYGSIYTDSAAAGATTYYYQVTAINFAGESGRSNEASAQTGTALLPGPTLTAAPGSAQVKLNWNKPTGASTFSIYRSVDNSHFAALLTGATANSYTDTAVTNGVTYYYQVAAANSKGQGNVSNTAAATPQDGLLPAPANLVVAGGSGQAGLYWNPVVGASGYNIYRATASGGEGVDPIAAISASTPSFSDSGLANATKYFYQVTAVNAVGESGKSNEASVVPGSPYLPAPILTASPGSGQAALRWSPVAGALTYVLARNTGSGFTYIQTGLTATSFTDTGLTNGVPATYYVFGVSRYSTGSGSAQVSVVPGSAPPRAPQVAASVVSGGSAIALNWANVTGAGSYNIYRSTAQGQEDRQPYAVGITPNGSSFSSYTDTNIANGLTYYYKIASVNNVGQGALSAEASAAPLADNVPDFLLSDTPDAITAARGVGTVSDDVPVTVNFFPVAGFSDDISLSISGLPSGVTAGFYPQVATVSGSALTLSLASSAAPGTYTLTVTATSGSLTHTSPITLVVLSSAISNVAHPLDESQEPQSDQAPQSELSPNLKFGPPLKGNWRCAPLRHASLLNDIGLLDAPVSAADLAGWKRELQTKTAQAATLHLWLGEYALAHDQQPEEALRAFHQVWSLSRDPQLRSQAAWDGALARFYAGAYSDATDAFHDLLISHRPAAGFDRQAAVMWWRRAAACAGYHAQRAALGIPEPTRLDPECGVAALAAGLRSLGQPYDRARLHGACRVTGEGSSLADILAAAPKLGIHIRPVSADDAGLRMLPKPLVAYVEHDHFIAVIQADKAGVSYLCSDCGPWPGGRVNLTWAQWHQLNATRYAVMTLPGSEWDTRMAQAESLEQDPLHPSLPARIRPLLVAAGLGAQHLLPGRSVRSLFPHVVLNYINPGGLTCGDKPNSPPCPPETCCPDDGPGGPGPGPGPGGPGPGGPGPNGPSDGDPVNLATGEENYNPSPDLSVYNPHGPSIAWKRMYRSLRGSFFAAATEFNDFGSGWSQTYNVGVYDPTQGGTGTKYVFYADGARDTFSAPSVPTAANPVVACATTLGEPLLVEWDYDARRPGGTYKITFPNRTKWITTAYDSAIGCCLLSQIVDRNGNAIQFNYSPPVDSRQWPLLSKITDPARKNTLLTIQRANDGTGNIVGLADAYGRSISYHCGFYPTYNVPQGYPQVYRQVDHISQVQPAHATTPADRWKLGYGQVRNTEGSETVPFLTAISAPSPTGAGLSTATIQYDPATDFVTSLTDANGNIRSYTQVDANGNVSSSSAYTQVTVTSAGGGQGYSYTVGFDNNMNETSRTNGDGQMVAARTFSDPNTPFRASQITDANGHTTQYTYDQFGNTLTETSPRNTVTTNTYVYTGFALGEMTRTVTGSKSATTYTYYEPSGQVHTMSDPLPGTTGSASVATTTFSYDSLGNVTQVVNPGNNADSTITTTYDYGATPAIAQPLTKTDNLGHATAFTYDARGNTLSLTDAIGLDTDYTYNLADDLTQVLAPATVSGGGRAARQTAYLYPGGPKLSDTDLDEAGQAARRVSYAYGPEGEVLSRTGSADPTTFTYDGLYRQSSLTDGGGHTTHYYYNSAGYLAAVTAPGYTGSAWPNISGPDSIRYTSYDALGNILKRVDGNGKTTTYAYSDPENKLTSITYPSGTLATVHNTYDSYGRRRTVTDGTGSSTLGYDDGDRTLSVQTTYTGLSAKTVSYTYYADGSRKTLVTPAGTYTSTYDAAKRLVGLTNPYGEPSSWTYLDNNVLKMRTLGNSSSAVVAATTYTYNARLFRTDQLTEDKNGNTLSEFGSTDMANPQNMMQYDAVGSRTQVKAALYSGGSLLGGPYTGTTTYAYDYGQTANPALNRSQITGETSGGASASYAYDGGGSAGPGNPTTFRGSAVAYNADNQTTGAGFAYDGNGNPTTYRGATLTYDVENRLTAYGSAFSAAYTTDGLRAWKQGSSSSSRVYFLYDAGVPVCELNSSGSLTAANTFGPDGLVSRHVGSTSTFYTFDPQGNVAQTLSSGGSVTNSFHFDAFGSRTSVSATTDPYAGFQGQAGGYTDAETGLTLFTLRYYNALTGRFLTRDPIGYQGGVNLYAYTKNNPLNRHDPAGTTDACPPKPNHCARDYNDCVQDVGVNFGICTTAAVAAGVIASFFGTPLAGILTFDAAEAACVAQELYALHVCERNYQHCMSD